MPSKNLNIRNLPPEVFEALQERMRRDRWFSIQELIIELIRDFADGATTPRAKPAPYDPARLAAGARRFQASRQP